MCLETEAFYALVKEVVDKLKTEFKAGEDIWIDTEEAMRLLGIASKTTLQGLRDEGKIRFTAPTPKIFLYDRVSIRKYLDKKARNTF